MRLKSLLHQNKTKNYMGGQVYATSASRSAAEVGVAEAAPASGGGIDPLVAGVKEIGVVPVAEAAEGEIIDTMPGAYFFAFSKKAFSSERGRPGEELIFSQLTTSPCAYENAMALGTSLQGETLHSKDGVVRGVVGFGKILQVRYIRLLLGPQPDKNLRKYAVNQLEDFLDRYPIRFQQAIHGQERIVVWLQSRRRHFTIFYKTKETVNNRKGIHQQA
jgi:hypothetical protein